MLLLNKNRNKTLLQGWGRTRLHSFQLNHTACIFAYSCGVSDHGVHVANCCNRGICYRLDYGSPPPLQIQESSTVKVTLFGTKVLEDDQVPMRLSGWALIQGHGESLVRSRRRQRQCISCPGTGARDNRKPAQGLAEIPRPCSREEPAHRHFPLTLTSSTETTDFCTEGTQVVVLCHSSLGRLIQHT